MTRYFMRDTPLCQMEQQMMTPPYFKPRGHGRYYHHLNEKSYFSSRNFSSRYGSTSRTVAILNSRSRDRP